MGVESIRQLAQGTEVVHLQVILVEPASATDQPEPLPCGPRRGALAVRDLLLQELLRAEVIEEQRAVAGAHGDDVLIEAQGAHTRAALAGAQIPDALVILAQIQERDMGLGAYRVQGQLIAVGQAHVVSAVRQSDGQQPGQGILGFPQVEVAIHGHGSQLLPLGAEGHSSHLAVTWVGVGPGDILHFHGTDVGIHGEPCTRVPGHAAPEYVGVYLPDAQGAFAGAAHHHRVAHPVDGEDPVFVAVVAQAQGIQRWQPVDGQAVGVLTPGGQQRLGGIQLEGMDAAALLGVGRRVPTIPHEGDARYLAGLHVHHEERVALGTAHHLPGVQPLRREHLVHGAQGQFALPQQLWQLPHREAMQLAIEA